MKITNIISNKIISTAKKVSRPFKGHIKFEPVQDVFVRRSRPAEIAADNILTVKKVGFNDYVFMDGKRKSEVQQLTLIQRSMATMMLIQQIGLMKI